MKPRSGLIAVLFAFLLSCATSPLGRKQLELVPASQVDAMGIQSFNQVKQQTPTETNPAINAYVRCVAVPITEAARGKTDVNEWEIVVFKNDEPNAFALPGGKIGVQTGIFKVAKNADQLATVLAHEVGHVVSKHGEERISEQLVTQGGLAALGALSGNKPVLMGLLGVGAQYGVTLPHSRTQESEADLVGLDLMSSAGFDPRQAVDLWKNFMSAGGGKPPEFLSDHPSDDKRIQQIQAGLPQEIPKFEQARASGHAPNCVNPS